MTTVVTFPGHWRPPSTVSRAAKRIRISADAPASCATSVDKIALHHSAGTASRCHHLETAGDRAPMSDAMASLEGHSSISARNESKSAMPESLRQLVLNGKDILSEDAEISPGHNVFMSRNPSDSEFKRLFLARTRAARLKSKLTQEQMADALGVEQSKYSKYEVRTVLPHHLIIPFCSLCEVSLPWLFTAAIEVHASKPKRRRGAKKLKVA